MEMCWPFGELITNVAVKSRATVSSMTTLEFDSSGNYQTERAERAVWTFKNHLLSTIAIADHHWPLYFWNEILFQAIVKLNLMRSSRINSLISTLGSCTSQIRFERNTQSTFCDNGDHPREVKRTRLVECTRRWRIYLDPAMLHYRCYTCSTTATAAIQVTDTVMAPN